MALDVGRDRTALDASDGSQVQILPRREDDVPRAGLRADNGCFQEINRTMNTIFGLCFIPALLVIGFMLLFMPSKGTSRSRQVTSDKGNLESTRLFLSGRRETGKKRVGMESIKHTTAITVTGRAQPKRTAYNTTLKESGSTTVPELGEYPVEAILAGVLFNKRRSFVGRAMHGSQKMPCLVQHRRCLFVVLGTPLVTADTFEFLVQSANVTFAWVLHTPKTAWPANIVKTVVATVGGTEVFYFGRTPGYHPDSLLAGVVRDSDGTLTVVDSQRMRKFHSFQVLVKMTLQYPSEKWMHCYRWCNQGAVPGGLEILPTFVGRAYHHGQFSFCKVLSTGCMMWDTMSTANIFEFLVESPGTAYDWVNQSVLSSLRSDQLVHVPHQNGTRAVVGRTVPQADGSVLLGFVQSDVKLLYALKDDRRMPPFAEYEVLAKRPATSQ
ncbi:uncharacterized protein LOC135385796 isoform X2 [Ornithodoros turicata]|uniref:uncharacterized protein LOC135385796 isoform X2 n=1 Tax=Ornithodoros turicata TaxID=34597 RepID=UPI0031395D38